MQRNQPIQVFAEPFDGLTFVNGRFLSTWTTFIVHAIVLCSVRTGTRFITYLDEPSFVYVLDDAQRKVIRPDTYCSPDIKRPMTRTGKILIYFIVSHFS